MTFDDELERAFTTLTDRLREEIAQHTHAVTTDLAASARADRDRAVAEAAEAADRAVKARAAAVTEEAERAAEVRIAAAVEEAERAASARLAAATDEAERAASARIAAATDEAERAAEVRIATATEEAERAAEARIADAAEASERAGEARIAAAADEAERAAGAQLKTAAEEAEAQLQAAEARAREEGREIGIEEGRFEGYEQGRAEGSRGTETATSERLTDAIRTLDRARSLSEILDTLASCAGREAARVGILLPVDDRFRGWRFIGFDASFDAARDIEFGAADAGVIADAAQSGAAVTSGAGRTTDAASGAARGHSPLFAALPEGRDSVAVPVAIGGEVVAVLYADQGAADLQAPVPGADHSAAWPDILEILARHAARCLESVVAIKAARVVTEQRHPAPARALDEAADERTAATRYAKLLVSEIRLYHEADVVAGRRDRDLSTRLGGEIARARVLYEQRVPPHVRERGDYFHEELVRTLAGGDPSLLELRT